MEARLLVGAPLGWELKACRSEAPTSVNHQFLWMRQS